MAANNRGRRIAIPLENSQQENVHPQNYIIGKSNAAVANKGRRPALGELNNVLKRNITSNKATTRTEQLKQIVTISQKEAKKVLITSSKVAESQKIVNKTEAAVEKPIDLKNKVVQEVKEVKSYSSQRLEILEESVSNDPQLVSEYVNYILQYLRELEAKCDIDEQFLSCHKTTTRMRSVLVNWLVDVHINFRMLPETLHLCIATVDRYLQKNKTVGRDNLQLVGVTALLIASKYEEMYIPDLGDFVYVCDDSFSKQQIKSMEVSILRTLDFSLGRPYSLNFLRRLSKVAKVQTHQHNLAKYILELCLLWDDLSYIRPSLQAAAAICLALTVLSEDNINPSEVWTETLVKYSTYTYANIGKIVKLMAAVIVRAETTKYDAIKKKYASSTLGKVSLCPELKGPIIKKLTQKKATVTTAIDL